MKLLVFATCVCIFLISCINSSTNFSNRGVTYQTTHELIGDKAYVANSPTTADATVNAEKTNELKANGSAYGAVTDNSTNEQKSSETNATEKTEPKSVEVPVESAVEAPSEENISTDDLNK